MNNKKLIQEIIRLYHDARRSRFSDKKIFRGRSHSISSSAEDLFAKFLISKVKCDQIFVDQPVSIDGIKNTIYPDLLICKDGVVIGTCDLKMDMGWNRDGLLDLCEKSFKLAKKIRNKECKIKEGKNKEIIKFKISKKYFHNIVMISDKNNNKVKLEQQIKESFKFNPLVNVFVLTSGKHLNTYAIKGEDLIEKIEIKNNEFNNLIKTLKC